MPPAAPPAPSRLAIEEDARLAGAAALEYARKGWIVDAQIPHAVALLCSSPATREAFVAFVEAGGRNRTATPGIVANTAPAPALSAEERAAHVWTRGMELFRTGKFPSELAACEAARRELDGERVRQDDDGPQERVPYGGLEAAAFHTAVLEEGGRLLAAGKAPDLLTACEQARKALVA